jgi:hypothetical protein
MGMRGWMLLAALVACGGGGAELVPRPDAACAGRRACQVLEHEDAGSGLLVVKTTGDRSIATQTSCTPFQYWLVAADGRKQRLLDQCDEDDEITVGPNRFEVTRRGGDPWRWETRRVLRLSPLALAEESGAGEWTVGDNREEWTWSWTQFRGRVTWFAPECALEGAAAAETRGEPPGESYEYLPVPRVELPPAFALSGWQRLSLGACAVDLADGFQLAGPPGARPHVRAVLSPRNELFLDGVPDGATVELWMADTPASYQDNCLSTPEQPPVHRVLDGAGGRRKVLLPALATALTVVVRERGRVFATSRLRPGRLATLGVVRPIPPAQATCVERDGALAPELTGRFDAARPVL